MAKFTGPFLHVFRDLYLAGFLYHRPEWMHPGHGAWQAEDSTPSGWRKASDSQGRSGYVGVQTNFCGWLMCVMDIYIYLSCRIRPGSIMAAAGSTSHTTASRPRLALLCKAMRYPAVIAGPLVLLPPGGWWMVGGK